MEQIWEVTPRLFSTDPALNAWKIYRYYNARFHIEFFFRDAKQFTGLVDGQMRDAEHLDFHFNAALTSLNLAKAELISSQPVDQPAVCSIASIKASTLTSITWIVLFPSSIGTLPA